MQKYFLTLIRHAKSSWQVSGQADHDRPLNNRGNRDAPVMAQRLINNNCIPDRILCSSAQRARETAQYFLSAFDFDENNFWIEPKLYLSSPETILKEVAIASTDVRHMMVIAHNPGLEQLSSLFSAQCSPAMPTLGIRHFQTQSLENISLSPGQYTPQGSTSDKLQSVELLFEDYPKNTR